MVIFCSNLDLCPRCSSSQLKLQKPCKSKLYSVLCALCTHTMIPTVPPGGDNFLPQLCLSNNRLLRHAGHKISWYYNKITVRFRKILQNSLSALQLHSRDSCMYSWASARVSSGMIVSWRFTICWFKCRLQRHWQHSHNIRTIIYSDRSQNYFYLSEIELSNIISPSLHVYQL